MRRSDRELKNRADIEDVLARARICHLALCRNSIPYVVPLNFGYAGGCLYMHSAVEGRKIEIIRANNTVSFAMYIDERLVPGRSACKWSTKYKSVMGQGKAFLLEDPQKKVEALKIILRHYSDAEFAFDPAQVARVTIIKVVIDSITGKQSI